MKLATISLSLFAFSGLVAAETFVVDDNGGACADFTEIADAVAAASDGDFIAVYPGLYEAFVIDNLRLTVVGLGKEPVLIKRGVAIQNLMPGRRVILSGVETVTLDVFDCAGLVQLSDLVLEERPFMLGFGSRPGVLWISNSSDVRAAGLVIDGKGELNEPDGVYVDGSRFELCSSSILAPAGSTQEQGKHGLTSTNGSRVHVTNTSLTGGPGGFFAGVAGDGGHGLFVESEVIVSGSLTDVIQGGEADGGLPSDGGDGARVAVSGRLVHSGVSFEGGVGTGSSGVPIDAPPGTVENPQPKDPALQVLDSASFAFRVFAEPGAQVELQLGRTPVVFDDGAADIELLVGPLRVFNLGTVPAAGFVDGSVSALAFQPEGAAFWLQAEVVYPANDLRRTNSSFVVIPPGAGPVDCDANGIADFCDIEANGDCDGDGLLDACNLPLEIAIVSQPPADVLDQFGGAIASDNGIIVIGDLDDGAVSGTGAAFVYVPDGQGWVLQQEITGAGGFNDRFGGSVAIEGDRIAVGAPSEDDLNNGVDAGAVYLFRSNGSTWEEEARLTAFNGFPGDLFGGQLALSQGTLIIGTFGDSTLGYPDGSAYVFTEGPEGWEQRQKLVGQPGAPGEGVGGSVAIDGSTAAVGGSRLNSTGFLAGGGFVYERSGEEWVRVLDILLPDTYFLGASVAVNQDFFFISDDGTNPFDPPDRTFVYRRNNGIWTQEQVLSACEPLLANDFTDFGRSLAIDGNLALVGSVPPPAGQVPGAAFLFEFDGANWKQRARLTASDGEVGDGFGAAVFLDDDKAFVGADRSNKVYVFDVSP